jgi:hypothetical protein
MTQLTGKLIERRKAPRIATNGRLPGTLVDASGANVPCRTLDVSMMGLGVVSDVEMPMGAEVTLQLDGAAPLKLRIVSAFRLAAPAPGMRYGLLLEEGDVNLEQVFRAAGCVEEPPPEVPVRGESGERRAERAPRFAPDQQLHVLVQTFGTRDDYEIVLENLSRSGLLVTMGHGEELPFRVNTLVDLVIDPHKRAFPKPIKATGKIVRRIDGEPGSEDARRHVSRLGIAIIEVQPGLEQDWQRALDALAVEAGEEVPQRPVSRAPEPIGRRPKRRAS